MDLYTDTASRLSKLLTRQYSTSFSAASRLFPQAMQSHIYNIYGLVRVADEIVDTYRGSDSAELLDALEQETYQAIRRGFSANPIIHAYAQTHQSWGIDQQLVTSFFASMRMDLTATIYDQANYDKYIYGSAEVVGLMCLHVFCAGNAEQYRQLQPGAQRLGAAYQKVNFLRDIKDDYQELGRFYFPGYTYATFDGAAKQTVTADIRQDFAAALPYIRALPAGVRPAVMTSYSYYHALLELLERADIDHIKQARIRIPAYRKALLLAPQALRIKR
ncbi:MAG TPA: phytoene/squalene synthase family protein [Candidatus Saccharimonadales bacterium]|jgi:phytoene/squalene synthetase